MKYLFYCALLLLLLFTSIGATAQVVAIGKEVPEILLPDLNGKTRQLSELKGKVVLLDFWASWCGPCRRSNKSLAPLYKKYKDKGFEIFGVSLDDKKEDWKKAVRDDQVNWVQVYQEGGWDAPVALQYKIEQLPTAILLDQQGKVIAYDPSKERIESELKKRLQ